MGKLTRGLVIGGAILLLGACDRDTLGSLYDARATPVAMPDAAEGAALFEANCAMCHGRDGTGGGPVARTLPASLPDLTRISARNGGTFPLTEVLSTLDGYSRKNADPTSVMPEFGALLEGDLVPVTLEDGSQSPVPRPLAALAFHLEAIQRP